MDIIVISNSVHTIVKESKLAYHIEEIQEMLCHVRADTTVLSIGLVAFRQMEGITFLFASCFCLLHVKRVDGTVLLPFTLIHLQSSSLTFFCPLQQLPFLVGSDGW